MYQVRLEGISLSIEICKDVLKVCEMHLSRTLEFFSSADALLSLLLVNVLLVLYFKEDD